MMTERFYDVSLMMNSLQNNHSRVKTLSVASYYLHSYLLLLHEFMLQKRILLLSWRWMTLKWPFTTPENPKTLRWHSSIFIYFTGIWSISLFEVISHWNFVVVCAVVSRNLLFIMTTANDVDGYDSDYELVQHEETSCAEIILNAISINMFGF